MEKSITSVFRLCLFLAVAVLCVYDIVFCFRSCTLGLSFLIPVVVFFGTLSWISTGNAVLLIAGLIPLASGVGHPELLNLAMSTIFLVWLSNLLFGEKKWIDSGGVIGLMTDALASLVILSLLTNLSSYPLSFVLNESWAGATLDPSNALFCIHMSVYVLHGLIMLRLVDLTCQGPSFLRKFLPVFRLQACIVVFFSLQQLLFSDWQWLFARHFRERGLHVPFEDIHAYGSTLLVLVCVLGLSVGARKSSTKVLDRILVVLLLAFLVLSFSRITYVALLPVAVGCLWMRPLSRRIFFPIAATVVTLFAVALTFMWPRIPLTGYTAYQFLNLDSLFYRFFRWRTTAEMIADYPLSGVGIGTYTRIYTHYSSSVNALESWQTPARLATENAHNYFLQLAAELGLSGVAVFLSISATVLWLSCRRRQRPPLEAPMCAGLAMGLAAYLLTCFVSHPLLLPNQQLFFWFAVGVLMLASRKDPSGIPSVPSSAKRFVAVLMILFVMGSFGRTLNPKSWPGYEYGLYAPEDWNGQEFRWTGKDSRFLVKPESNILRFQVVVNEHSIPPTGLALQLASAGRVLEAKTFFRPGSYVINCFLLDASSDELDLRVTLSDTFSPFELGLSSDRRELGIAIAPVEFEAALPTEGIGFYDWETTSEAGTPPWGENRELKFRWTGKSAVLPLTEKQCREGLHMAVSVLHPDIQEEPVSLEVQVGQRPREVIKLKNSSWRSLEFKPEQLEGQELLYVWISRTWNPRALGHSPDERDLGVRFSVLE